MGSGSSATSGRPDAPALPSAVLVLRERWLIIALTTLLGVAVGIAYAVTSAKSYQATAKVLFQPSSPISDAVVQGSTASLEDPTRVAATDLLLITSGAVGDAVRQSLGLKISTSDLLSKVTASEETNADLFDITATDGDAVQAARIANAFAAQFVAFRRRIAQQDAIAAETDLKRRLASLSPSDTADRAQLQAALQRVLVLGAVQTGDATVVDTAGVPTSASSPRPKLDAVLGLVFGFGLGLGLAFLVDLTDRRIKDDEGFEAAYGLSTLVHVPARSMTTAGSQPRAPAFEPYRILGGTLTFSKTTAGVRSVLITSAVAQEGKTTVAAGLAKALADSGHTVSLVELDQRRPSLTRHFALKGEAGLTTALMNREPVANLLQQPVPSLPRLNVLPGGPRIPLELLRSSEMDRVMEQLLELSEIVIYDAPPILGVAEAQALLDHPRIDASLIVGRAYRTTRDEAKRTRAILDQRLVRPLGLVLTGLDEPGAGGAYYTASQARDGQEAEVAPVRGSRV